MSLFILQLASTLIHAWSIVHTLNITILTVVMERDPDGDGWKYGLSFICLGIVFVLSMGVFSMVYYGGRAGTEHTASYLTLKYELYRIRQL